VGEGTENYMVIGCSRWVVDQNNFRLSVIPDHFKMETKGILVRVLKQALNGTKKPKPMLLVINKCWFHLSGVLGGMAWR
jgi:hypothetical protein